MTDLFDGCCHGTGTAGQARRLGSALVDKPMALLVALGPKGCAARLVPRVALSHGTRHSAWSQPGFCRLSAWLRTAHFAHRLDQVTPAQTLTAWRGVAKRPRALPATGLTITAASQRGRPGLGFPQSTQRAWA